MVAGVFRVGAVGRCRPVSRVRDAITPCVALDRCPGRAGFLVSAPFRRGAGRGSRSVAHHKADQGGSVICSAALGASGQWF